MVPSPEDFQERGYKAAFKYAHFLKQGKNPREINELILDHFTNTIYPKAWNSFNYDIYLRPEFGIAVLDFDDFEETTAKLEFLCENSSEFNLHWSRFKKEYLDKTFLVKTPSGGEHYYLRPSKVFLKRKVKCLFAEKFLSEEKLEKFIEKFSNPEDRNTMIALDLLCNGNIIGPGNVIKNQLKKGKVILRREYKIIRDVPFIEIDVEKEPFFNYIFGEIEEENIKFKEQQEVVSKIRKTSKRKSNTVLRYNFKELMEKADKIKSLNWDTSADELRIFSEQLTSQKEIIENKIALIEKYEQSENKKDQIRANSERDNLLNEKEIFNLIVEEALKDLYYSNPESEYIYNVLRRYEYEGKFLNKEKRIYPINFDNIGQLEIGKRSELENAFIVHLKVRNFRDSFIYYLIQRDFPSSIKSLENPEFFQQALDKAHSIINNPEHLTQKGIWNEILNSISLVRKIDFEKMFYKSGGKIRTLVESLYDEASILNDFKIKKSQKALSIGGMSSLSNKSIKKYLILLENHGFLKSITWEVENDRKKYPKIIELRNVEELRNVYNIKYLDFERISPQDGNQNVSMIPGIKNRGMEIIGYLREAGSEMLKSDLYSLFKNIPDYRRQIYKNIKKLEESGLVKISVDKKSIKLVEKSFNKAYEKFADKYNKSINEQKNHKRKKDSDPVDRRLIRYEFESIHMNKRKGYR
ncbi:hypothetical protein [Leptospira stimsonii]|uniref:hypothetical protein n=1 Tax=Leptospira stimsonii TaxID=2202203 RepID=UPI001082B215|nr:hypothetical protein [Leptospira stimsonii]